MLGSLTSLFPFSFTNFHPLASVAAVCVKYVNLLDCTVHISWRFEVSSSTLSPFASWCRAGSKAKPSEKQPLPGACRPIWQLAALCACFSSNSPLCHVHRSGWNLEPSVEFLLQGLDLLSCMRRSQDEELLHNRVEAAPIGLRRTAASACKPLCYSSKSFFCFD